jgi:hypothetical protein
MEDVGICYGHLVFLRPFGIFCDHLVNLMVIWYIFSVLVFWDKKNLATLNNDFRNRSRKFSVEKLICGF